MEKTDKAPGLDLLKVHKVLEAELEKLDKTVSPAAQTALTDLYTCLDKIHSHLLHHFQFEDEGGYMADVVSMAPQKNRLVEDLHAEHKVLGEEIGHLVDQAKVVEGSLDALRQKITAWVAKVEAHEHQENTLVQEAYNLDIGNKD